MAKMRWTEARWANRAQKARGLANNILAPVRRQMMLEMAEFYDRLAKLTRDLKTAGGRPVARRRKRSKVSGGVARPLIGAKPTQEAPGCAADSEAAAVKAAHFA
jgi:hypothetical protein